ncbi:MAG: tRNA (adenosine(37)-N6)-threonylcarbamoyltransferase complex dimerization subunit type 1 TsaB [Eubacteriales bacterium]|nr:tRNA (adenosine(37)-N6)-threonylcarbamoyltransferase complex dimerization subunit type 1 TsaB [Eubacteriales bacterium]
MRILGIESASLTASAAVVTETVVEAEYTVNFKQTHSQTLLPMIDEIVRMLGLDMDTVDAIAVSGGPGSFTGLRIGSATAKGLGLALKKPLIHVPTLDAMAWNLYGTSALICPMMDARRQQVYTGLYRFDREFQVELASCSMDIHQLTAELNRRGERVIFLGDGVPVCRDVICRELTAPFDFAPVALSRQRAACVAALGAVYLAEGKTETAAEHKPDYLKKAQAERELEEAGRQGKLGELAAGHSVGTGEIRDAVRKGETAL